MNQYLLRNPIVEDSDPLVVGERVFNRTLLDMKEDLLEAINNRKGKVLQIALEIFNKVQDQSIKSIRLGDVANKKKIDPSEIDETLQKYQLLLNDQRSPVWSAITTMTLARDQDIPDFNYLYSNSSEMLNSVLPIDQARREGRMLNELNEQLFKTQNQLKGIHNQLIQQLKDIQSGKSSYDQT